LIWDILPLAVSVEVLELVTGWRFNPSVVIAGPNIGMPANEKIRLSLTDCDDRAARKDADGFMGGVLEVTNCPV
jgi:hypothetical protein